MKKFWEISKKPLRIAIIATVLCVIDALIAQLFVKGASFMWVAFVFWTVFFSSNIKDRIKGMIGVLIGFLSAIVMMAITNSFTLNIYTISVSCLIGVFVVNGIVMFLEKTEKFWTNSITGVFVGIFLTFSGLGVGLTPISNTCSFFTMLGILFVYGLLGMLCGYLSVCKFTRKNTKKKKKIKIN